MRIRRPISRYDRVPVGRGPQRQSQRYLPVHSGGGGTRWFECGRAGAAMNLASIFRSSPRGVHYVASKAGIVGVTRATAGAGALPGTGERHCPGTTDTTAALWHVGRLLQAAARGGRRGAWAPGRLSPIWVSFWPPKNHATSLARMLHVNGGQYHLKDTLWRQRVAST